MNWQRKRAQKRRLAVALGLNSAFGKWTEMLLNMSEGREPSSLTDQIDELTRLGFEHPMFKTSEIKKTWRLKK